MGHESKFAKAFRRARPQKRIWVVAAFFLIPLLYFIFFDSFMNPRTTYEVAQSRTSSRKTSQFSTKVVSPPMTTEISGEGLIEEEKPVCDVSDPKTDVCEIDGEVWIQGSTSSSVNYYAPYANDSWIIRPYPRKQDRFVIKLINEVLVKPSMTHEGPHQCNVNYSVPAIVFSMSGYTGNFFHDFTDVIIPLFLTSRQYNGEVQFLAAGRKAWWIKKYKLILNRLSNYNIIDFNQDDRIHCFQHAIVGLQCHPSKSPGGYSMVDFSEFMRTTFSLEKESAITIKEYMNEEEEKKPRLLIISRKRTRRFRNLEEIIHMAKSFGYDVIAVEADEANVAKFAKLVNSFDVLMGVQGAGLTNLLFLPMNAVLIQIVPLGGLQWLSRNDYGEPAIERNLKYLEYEIKDEESSLIEEYPRDHAVFKDAMSIFFKNGWNATKEIFLVKQDVRLDVNRFRGVLEEALKLLHS